MSNLDIKLVLRASDLASAKLKRVNAELRKMKQLGVSVGGAGAMGGVPGVGAGGRRGGGGLGGNRGGRPLGTRLSRSGSAISQTGSMAARAAIPLAAGFGMAAKEAANFDQALKNIEAKTADATTESLKRLREESRRVAKSPLSKSSSTEVLSGGLFLAQAGFGIEDQITALETITKLSTAAGASMEQAGDISTNIMSGFGMEADELEAAADVLALTAASANVDLMGLGNSMKFVAPVAKVAGAEFEEVAAMIGTLGNAGIQGTMAGRSLRMAYVRLQDPPKKAAGALEMLGVSAKDADGNLRPMSHLLEEIHHKTKGLGSAEKGKLISRIFGTNSASSALALMDNLDKLRELTTDLESADGENALTKMAETMSEGDAFKFEQMKRDMKELAIDVGPPVIDLVRELARDVKPLVRDFTAWAKENPEVVKTIAKLTGGLLLAAPALMAVGSALSAAGSLMTAFGGTAAGAAGGVLSLTSSLGALAATPIFARALQQLDNVGKENDAEDTRAAEASGVGISRDLADSVKSQGVTKEFFEAKDHARIRELEKSAVSRIETAGVGGLIGAKKRGFGGGGTFQEELGKEAFEVARRERQNFVKGKVRKGDDVSLSDFGGSGFGRDNMISRALEKQRKGKIEVLIKTDRGGGMLAESIQANVVDSGGDFEIETGTGSQ